MKKYIILFKGVNVGGKNLLPMKELVSLLAQHNYQEVSSYIQSGNVVLKSATAPSEAIQKIVLDNFGFSPETFLLNENEFSTVLASNPYQAFEGKFVHFYFCHELIEVNLDKLNKYITKSEEYFIKGKVFYLHAPEGIGRSKLISNIEVCLDQAATGRNLNTVRKVSTMFTESLRV